MAAAAMSFTPMSALETTLAIALLALLVERLAGYPAMLQRAIGHPVQWMGATIAVLERRFNDHARFSAATRRWWGITAMIALALFWVGLAWLLARWLPWWGEALAATTLLAQRSLKEHVQAIIDALPASASRHGSGAGLIPARRALSMIVGRDTSEFDESRIAHAAIESLAENASDGIVAPLFWLLIAGLPGIVLYKLVNTADSMIGHLDQRHRHFGFAAAKLDDLLNWLPARLTALLYAATSALTCGLATGKRALHVAWRDARKHVSPNAGWPEAAMAGALDIRLGGPRSYQGRVVDFPWLGEGREQLSRNDMRTALALHERMLWMLAALLGVLFAATGLAMPG